MNEVLGRVLNYTGSREDPVASFCEHGHETSDLKKKRPDIAKLLSVLWSRSCGTPCTQTGPLEHLALGQVLWNTLHSDRSSGTPCTQTGPLEHPALRQVLWNTLHSDRSSETPCTQTGPLEHPALRQVLRNTLHSDRSCGTPCTQTGPLEHPALRQFSAVLYLVLTSLITF